MKRILVTGSSGSLGSLIVEKLRKNPEYQVVGIDFNPEVMGIPTTQFHVDLTNQQSVEDFFLENWLPFDYVIHCAATIYGVAGFNENGYKILSNDLVMTINLLNNLTTEKFIYLSSSMVYERSGYEPGRGVTEESLLNGKAPKTGYGLSKYTGEALVREWANSNDKNVFTIWRPFNIITPYEESQKELGYSHVFADFFNNILVKKLNPIPIIGDGYQVRCFTWIDDVADAIVDNLEIPATDNQDFNIGNPEPLSMRKFGQLIYDEGVQRGYLPDDELRFTTQMYIENDVRYRAPDISKAKNLLKFEPTVNTKEAIRLCMNEWEKNL